ncbi:MAG: TolC family protein [Bacteroidales bacterium]|nr:TolC family protein [Bacteroidales bacterium]
MRPLLIVLTMVVLGVAPCSALTLDEARMLATERYPLVRDYQLIELTQKYNLSNAQKAWLPQPTLGTQGVWQSTVASYPDVLSEMLQQRGLNLRGVGHFQYKATLDVTQTIYDGGRISASKEMIKAQSREDALSNEVDLYNLRSRIDDLFFSILLMERQKATLEQTDTLLQANLDRVNTLVANGAAMLSDADAIAVDLLSTRQQIASVTATIAAYRKVLGLYLGTDGQETLEIPSQLLLPGDDSAAQRPEWQLLDARQSSLNAQERQVKASLLPTIGAFAQGSWGYPGANFMEAMINRDPKWGATIGLSASWSIGELYTRKGRLSQIQAQRQRLDVAKDVFQFNTSLQASQQRADIQRLIAISKADDEIVALRQRVRMASEARLSEGIVEPTDLLLRITDERNAIIAAESHYIEMLKAQYSLQNTLNQ